jgi:YgiT-type zinc finger domain-containing protein
MKCPLCNGDLERGTATFTDSRHGYTVVVNDVPAWVCGQCGEPMFEGEAVEGIQDLLRDMDQNVDRIRRAA